MIVYTTKNQQKRQTKEVLADASKKSDTFFAVVPLPSPSSVEELASITLSIAHNCCCRRWNTTAKVKQKLKENPLYSLFCCCCPSSSTWKANICQLFRWWQKTATAAAAAVYWSSEKPCKARRSVKEEEEMRNQTEKNERSLTAARLIWLIISDCTTVQLFTAQNTQKTPNIIVALFLCALSPLTFFLFLNYPLPFPPPTFISILERFLFFSLLSFDRRFLLII